MAAATRKCKVCGAEYEYCHTARRVAGVFRWQDVACCAEHGSIYLARILASRSTEPVSNSNEVENEEEPEDEYDDLYEDDESDEEDFDFDEEYVELTEVVEEPAAKE